MTILRICAVFAAFLGLTSVVMGAAGDHLLEGMLTPEVAHTFDIALRYHQLYAVLILALSLFGLRQSTGRAYEIACMLFVAGIFIFSGSLYASLWMDLGPLAFGTPVGGMLLMAGWIMTGFSLIRSFFRGI